jgi:hypothetical protein
MIVSYEAVSQMLTELGPSLNAEEIAAFEEGQSWAIAFDDETIISLDYEPDTAKLYFTGDLGAPPEDKLFTTYEFLLQYNRYWSETDGVRMALEKPGGNVAQIFDLSLHDLEAHKLGTVLENFLMLMRTMRAVLQQGVAGDTPPPDPDHLMPMGSIRV